MKTARKKILSLALAVLLVLTGIAPMSVQAATVEGDGYSFDTETGVLTVSTNAGTTAWQSDSNIVYTNIKSVVLEEGITEIGDTAFEYCSNLESVSFPASLEKIGEAAFFACRKLKNVDLSNCTNLTTIEYQAFNACLLLESVVFPASLQSIESEAFGSCESLTTLRFLGITPPTLADASNILFLAIPSNGTLYYPSEGVVGGTKYNPAYFNPQTLGGNQFSTWTFSAFDADAAPGVTAITPAYGYGGEITNDDLEYTVTPTETGYVIDEVLIDGVSQTVTNRSEFTYTFTDDGKSHSIFATFAYTVNFNSPANGSLTVASAGNLTSGTIVRGGQALEITAEPESGYVLQSLTVNGTDVTSSYSNGYTYTVGTLDTTRTRMVGGNKVADQGADIVAVFALSGGGGGTAPTITPMTLPNGTVDTAYSATLTATGDTPITWSVVSGALPDGLNLSSDGELSGTPTADGTFTFTVTATNSAGSATSTLSITISAAAATVDSVTVSPSVIEVEKGTTQQFGATVTGTNNPANSVTWSLYDYSGSSEISSSGLLTVAAGETESELTVRATSTVDPTEYGEATVTITDSAPAPVYSISLGISGTHSFPAATESYGAQAPLSVTVTNTGNQATGDLSVELSGTDEGSFAVAPDTISSIATASNATFTVTPETGLSAGTHTAAVTVSGDNGISETFDVSFTVNPAAPSGTAPTITTTTLPGGTVGTTYSQTLTATGDALITWSIDSGDLPDGLDISGNIISGTPTEDGTFTFTVKAENDEGDDTKQLSITIAPATAPGTLYTITFNANGGSVSSATMTTGNDGKLSALPTPTRSGSYSFDGWYTAASGGTKISTSTVFAGNDTVYAHWTYTGGGSNSGGSSSSSTPTVTIPAAVQPNQPTVGSVSGKVAGTNTQRTFTVTDSIVKAALEKAQAEAKTKKRAAYGVGAQIALDTPAAAGLTLTLERAALNRLVNEKAKQFELTGAPISLTFDVQALSEIQKQSTGNVIITVKPVTVDGVRNAYDITLTTVKDGKTVSITSLGNGSATLSIPSTPGKNEAAGYLYAVYVDGNGKLNRIADSTYDANSSSVIFSTNHFSVYGVGYTAPSAKFTDIGSHWAKESIDYVVGRGLFGGTSDTTFAPDTAMTRGMLVTVLGRLAGVDTKAYTTNSFTDVKADSTFRPYIEWAYSKGIVQGIGNSQFAPDRAITRQEIAIIFANFAKATGYTLPITREATTYADASNIGSAYKTTVTAMQQAGIMMGEQNNKFNPTANATRAEVSSMLHRYIKLTIDPATAQGWAKNDDGQFMYYKDGKAVTGTQTIDGVKYYFNDNGTLKTGWVKDDTGNWHFYSGNILLVGFWDIGANGNNKRYYFDTYGNMISGKWLQIDGKWYYFYSDGSLAVSTTVDGYSVGKDGARTE